MLSQFTKEGDHQTLADLSEKFPIDVYPVGRLDADSEGLLLLTNDKRVNSKLLDPTTGHQRTYLVQVEGEVTEEALETLRRGMELSIDGKVFLTRPAKAEVVNELPDLPERNPPVRFRKNIPTSWIRLSLVEGKNRQVRKMTAKVGFPTLRLIRESIHEFSMSKMVSGNIETVERAAFYSKLGLR